MWAEETSKFPPLVPTRQFLFPAEHVTRIKLVGYRSEQGKEVSWISSLPPSTPSSTTTRLAWMHKKRATYRICQKLEKFRALPLIGVYFKFTAATTTTVRRGYSMNKDYTPPPSSRSDRYGENYTEDMENGKAIMPEDVVGVSQIDRLQN